MVIQKVLIARDRYVFIYMYSEYAELHTVHVAEMVSWTQRNLFSVSVGRDSNHCPSYYMTESDLKTLTFTILSLEFLQTEPVVFSQFMPLPAGS